jgi:hypothetical protein
MLLHCELEREAALYCTGCGKGLRASLEPQESEATA